MNKENEIKFQIEKNLLDFYLSWIKHPSIEYVKFKEVWSLKNKDGLWPNLILNNNAKDFEVLLNATKSIIEIKEEPNFWLTNYDLLIGNENIIKNNKFIPVKKWVGMYLFRSSKFDINFQKKIDIEEITCSNSLINWVKLVNKTTFNSKKVLDVDILKPKLDNPDFKFYQGKYKGEVVTTLLTYFNNDTLGLYFISTKKEHQGFGFATNIIKDVLNKEIERGIFKFVLHASSSGFRLYKKIDFAAYNQFVILAKN